MYMPGLSADHGHGLLIRPLAEIDDAPTDNAIKNRDRPAFDHGSQRSTMLVLELAVGARPVTASSQIK
jgi:hypothetical protein